MAGIGEDHVWLDDLEDLDTGQGLEGDTALSSPAVSDHTGSALRQFGDPDFCRNPASQPLSLPAVSIADQSTKPGNDQLRDQPSQNPFTSSPLEYASGSSLQSADVQIQASVPEHAFEALATVKCSRAAAQSAVPHASGCGLQDLPPEVLMHILASLPLQARLTAGQTSQWLHSAVLQPHFWPTHPPGASGASNSDCSAEARLSAKAAAPSARAGQTVEASLKQPHRYADSVLAGGAELLDPMQHVPPQRVSAASPSELLLRPPLETSAGEAGSAQSPGFQSAACSLLHPSGISNATCSEPDEKQLGLQSALSGSSTEPSHGHQNYQQEQQQQGSFSNNKGPADMTWHAGSDWKTQGSLLGCTTDGSDAHRGPTVLVAVVDPVTGQQGYAKRDKAHGLVPRPSGKVGQDVALRSSLLKAGLAIEAPDSPYGAGWLLAKHITLAERHGPRFNFLRAAHDQMRILLCKSWEQAPQASALSTNLRQLLKKLTKFSWSVTYDAICCALEHRADCMALSVRTSPALLDMNRGGMELWRKVLQSWRTYRAWALRLVGACGLLAECVSAEQAAEQMARGLPATPSLFGAARLAFRSQVLLAYGIRRPLQRTLRQAQLLRQTCHQSGSRTASRVLYSSQQGLSQGNQGPKGCPRTGPLSPSVDSLDAQLHGDEHAPEPQDMVSAGCRNQQAGALSDSGTGETAWMVIETFLEVRKLLEEMDVADDITRPKACHTHGKFRQCFGLEPRPGQLQVKGPLRIPKE